MKLPNILITNDDGVNAPGIKNLILALRGMGNLFVVAPDSPQSGMGHAITTDRPLKIKELKPFEGMEDVAVFSTNGTPVDCVKMAKKLIGQSQFDLCASGINHGSNASINVIYSGTMSAAMEGAIEGIPSVGFSLMDWREEADFTVSRQVVKTVVSRLLTKEMPNNLLLNVNIPKLSIEEFKGIRVCRQSRDKWEEDFIEKKDPQGNAYYWMTGTFVNGDKDEDTDIYSLNQGFATIVPITIDFTDYQRRQWVSDFFKF